MKLLLTSNGLLNTPLEKDFQEMMNGRAGRIVAIIPTASDPIEWYPEHEGDEELFYLCRPIPDVEGKHAEWLRSYQKEWEQRGFRVVIADLKEDPAELKKKLEGVNVIDVLGGDVNYLLDWAKRSKLDTYLKDLLDSGVIYIGTSAGSGLINPDIGLTWWNPGEKLDHVGLGIVDFIVVPHQKESDERSNEANLMKRRDYLRTVIDFPWKIYLVQDGQAIKVDGEKVEHIGTGTKTFI